MRDDYKKIDLLQHACEELITLYRVYYDFNESSCDKSKHSIVKEDVRKLHEVIEKTKNELKFLK